MTTTAHAEGLRLVRELLGIEDPTVDALLALARTRLGNERTNRCIECVRLSPLSRREYTFGSLAQIAVAAASLEPEWWTSRHAERVSAGTYVPTITPDEALLPAPGPWPTPLDRVAYWAADAVADRLWGPAYDYVDMNSMKTSDRFALPAGARVGERIVLDWDPGARLDAVVVERRTGVLGSELDLSSMREASATDAWWGWCTVVGYGPHRLPDERSGRAPDPYARAIAATQGDRLRTWAAAHGLDEACVRAPWQHVADVVRAIVAADLVRRGGEWFAWARACDAVVDGDAEAAGHWLTQLASLDSRHER